MGQGAAVEAAIGRLCERMGDRLSRNASVRETHSHGEDAYPRQLADAVLFCESTDDVAFALSICSELGAAVIPFGAGTSLEGHITPVQGGIVLDLSRMQRVLAVNAADMDCRVEAGVTRQRLNQELRDQGLFFSVDPGGEATIGGMCATRASGTNTIRYGTIRDNVLSLQVVTPSGAIVETGRRVRKSAMGYDLTSLFIGSEGTLGVVTEVQLKLHGIPETSEVVLCQFDRLNDAVDCVLMILQQGLIVARAELLDEVQMAASIAYSGLQDLSCLATIIFEFSGSIAMTQESVAVARAIAAEAGATVVRHSKSPAENAVLWKARHHALWAAKALRPDHQPMITDAIVPISNLPAAVAAARNEVEASGLTAPILGHVGDGNFHTIILVPPDSDGWLRARRLDEAIVNHALGLGGSASGEHGVGLGKREFLVQQFGASGIDLMRSLKTGLDPKGIMNPGKLFLN